MGCYTGPVPPDWITTPLSVEESVNTAIGCASLTGGGWPFVNKEAVGLGGSYNYKRSAYTLMQTSGREVGLF